MLVVEYSCHIAYIRYIH